MTDLCWFCVTLCTVCAVSALSASKPPLSCRNDGLSSLRDQEVPGPVSRKARDGDPRSADKVGIGSASLTLGGTGFKSRRPDEIGQFLCSGYYDCKQNVDAEDRNTLETE